jgi:hypothetical protein
MKKKHYGKIEGGYVSVRGRGTYSMMDAFFQTGSNVHHEVWGGIKRFIKKKKKKI